MITRREVKIIRDGSRAAHRDIIIRIRATAIHTAYRMMGELRRGACIYHIRSFIPLEHRAVREDGSAIHRGGSCGIQAVIGYILIIPCLSMMCEDRRSIRMLSLTSEPMLMTGLMDKQEEGG